MIDDLILNAEQNSRDSFKLESGDYIGDGSRLLYRDGKVSLDGNGKPLTDKGLIYCGKCNQLKHYRIFAKFLSKELEPFVLCKCGEKLDQREHDRIIEENRQRRIAENLANADALLLKSTFATDKRPNSEFSRFALDYCRCWRDKYQPNGTGLFIYGDVGVGKTFLASCIANAVAKTYGCSIKALSVTKAINDLFSTENKSAYIDDLAGVDLLVLDDFGAERRTDYALEQVFSIVDRRYNTQKPLIITSNLDYKLLEQPRDLRLKRIFSRVRGMCIPLEITGQSMRQPPS